MAGLFDDIVVDKNITIENEHIEEYGKQYAVIIHNDDITPFDFVVFALMEIFEKNIEEAISLAYKVHTSTKGTAGIYDKTTAYEKLNELDSLKQEYNFFLLATVEEIE